MKYFIAAVNEVNGEFEYTTHVSIVAETKRQATSRHKAMVKEWYSCKAYKSNGGYDFQNGTFVSEGDLIEVGEQTYMDCRRIGI